MINSKVITPCLLRALNEVRNCVLYVHQAPALHQELQKQLSSQQAVVGGGAQMGVGGSKVRANHTGSTMDIGLPTSVSLISWLNCR